MRRFRDLPILPAELFGDPSGVYWVFVACEQQMGQFGAGPHAEFAIGARKVGFHCLAGDEKGRRSLDVVEPSPYGSGDLELLWAEGVQDGGTAVVSGTSPDAGGT